MGYKVFVNLNFLFDYVLYLINMFRILGLITSLDKKSNHHGGLFEFKNSIPSPQGSCRLLELHAPSE